MTGYTAKKTWWKDKTHKCITDFFADVKCTTSRPDRMQAPKASLFLLTMSRTNSAGAAKAL